MIHLYHETSSKTEAPIHLPIRASFPKLVPNETVGRTLYANYLPMRSAYDRLKSAWESTDRLLVETTRIQARQLLRSIEEALSILDSLGADISYIPPLRSFTEETGALQFEWTFSDYRVGFSLEPTPEDSGWFLISNRRLGQISASGFTSGTDPKETIIWLLQFILAHS